MAWDGVSWLAGPATGMARSSEYTVDSRSGSLGRIDRLACIMPPWPAFESVSPLGLPDLSLRGRKDVWVKRRGKMGCVAVAVGLARGTRGVKGQGCGSAGKSKLRRAYLFVFDLFSFFLPYALLVHGRQHLSLQDVHSYMTGCGPEWHLLQFHWMTVSSDLSDLNVWLQFAWAAMVFIFEIDCSFAVAGRCLLT